MSTEGKSGERGATNNSALVKMTPEAHLFKTYAFWLAVTVPPAIAIAFILLAVCQTPLYWNPTAEGFKFFYDHFKLQIAIGSLAIPMGALVATHHRSMQTSKQIRTQQSEIKQQRIKDGIALHAEHKKQFVDFMQDAKPFGKHSTINAWELYELLYPDSASHVLTLNDSVRDLVRRVKLDLEFEVSKLTEEDRGDIPPRNQVERSIEAVGTKHELFDLLGVDFSPDLSTETPHLTELTLAIKEITQGVIDCANFQVQSIDRNASKAIRTLVDTITFLEERLENRVRVADDISNAILALNGMDYEKLLHETKERIKNIVHDEMDHLRTPADIQDLKMIVEYHLRHHNDRNLMRSYLDELIDYFKDLY